MLREGADLATQRFLTDEDIKKIKILKMRNAVKHVDRKRFRDPNDDESKNSSSDDDGEEGEDEGEEMGEDELSSSMNSEKAQKIMKMMKDPKMVERMKRQ